jgi:hypothetical protein
MAYGIAIVVGFVFGAADQYLGSLVELGPWAAAVSGMSAPWLVFPFVFGSRQATPRGAILIGMTATFSALLGYFVMTLSPVEGVSLSNVDLVSFVESQWPNIVGAFATAPLFGYLGLRWRERRSWVAAALVAGAVCLEPAARYAVGRLDPPTAVWATEVLLGVLLAAYFAVRIAVRRHGLPGSTAH